MQVIVDVHNWWNMPLPPRDWGWALSGARILIWIFLGVLIFFTVKNAAQMQLKRRYAPMIVSLCGLWFYYLDQLFLDTKLNVSITPAIIAFNLLFAGLIAGGFALAATARGLVERIKQQERDRLEAAGLLVKAEEKRRHNTMSRRLKRQG